MSLTSFLSQPEIRAAFKQAFPKPTIHLAEMSQPAIPSNGNPQLIGTAFDYLARFAIERAHPEVPVNQRPWIAESAVARMQQAGMPGHLVAEAMALTQTMRSHWMEYTMMADLSDELVSGCIDLAKLDVFFRSYARTGLPPAPFGDNGPEHIEEMRDLLERARDFVNHPCEEVHLNPTFGSWSTYIGGADADVIYDHELTDIKTVKEPKVRPDDYFQLVGYALLSDLAIEDGDDAPRIDSIAIYSSRFGAWWRTDLAEAKQADSWNEMKAFMRNRLEPT